MPNVDSRTLEMVVDLMAYACEVQYMDFKEQFRHLSAAVIKRLSRIENLVNLINAVNYLDIQILNAPLADGIIRWLHQMYHGDRELIATIVKFGYSRGI